MNKLLCLTLFITVASYGMEKESNHTKGMVKINTTKDMEPFIGKIIAYTAESGIFALNQGYTLRDPDIKYGYVTKEYKDDEIKEIDTATLYSLPKTFKHSDVLIKCPKLYLLLNHCYDHSYERWINDKNLRDASLQVRIITKQEANYIDSIITNKKISFEHLDKESKLHYKILKHLKRFSFDEGSSFELDEESSGDLFSCEGKEYWKNHQDKKYYKTIQQSDKWKTVESTKEEYATEKWWKKLNKRNEKRLNGTLKDSYDSEYSVSGYSDES